MEISSRLNQKLLQVEGGRGKEVPAGDLNAPSIVIESSGVKESAMMMQSGIEKLLTSALVRCTNMGCEAKLAVADIKSHLEACEFRPVAVCESGCGLPIVLRDIKNANNKNNTVRHSNNQLDKQPLVRTREDMNNIQVQEGVYMSDMILGNCKDTKDGNGLGGLSGFREGIKGSMVNHDCLMALKVHVNRQQARISALEEDARDACGRLRQRERILLAQVAKLQSKLQLQGLHWQRKVKACHKRLSALARQATEHLVKVRNTVLGSK